MLFALVIPARILRLIRRAGGRIRCPKCAWKPGKDDRWCCEPGCGCIWNTFETRGRCPDCDKTWQETICPHCGQWSRHEEWYESE